MKRATVVGIVVGGVVALGVAAAVALSLGGGEAPVVPAETPQAAPSESRSAPSDAATPEPSMPADDQAANDGEMTPGAYVEYGDAELAAAEGTRVLFFHAPWCPQCRALEADILASGVPDGVTVLKVDYDSRQDLRQRYGVTIQTTLVALDDAADPTAVFVAYDEPTLESGLDGLGLTR
ncbi:thioredoxin family protein [Microbacterium sp. HD4P20]|uniref:thioredoxin family protein n=1 Tax=Microbacterium sp. HD4P20 TaxID=2864874 RepID=UPI001C640FA9|nr:thioredoxin family protein [Microbacterium sp. HD4P20]MCP2638470.1 thioredoxin family protein [Microbacterium sp. HD4P20]